MNVEFSPQANADLLAIHAYISDQDKLADDRILSRLRQATETLRHHPLLGRTGEVSGTRELPVHGLPYTIIYRIVSTAQLDIVTILHQRMLYPLMEG